VSARAPARRPGVRPSSWTACGTRMIASGCCEAAFGSVVRRQSAPATANMPMTIRPQRQPSSPYAPSPFTSPHPILSPQQNIKREQDHGGRVSRPPTQGEEMADSVYRVTRSSASARIHGSRRRRTPLRRSARRFGPAHRRRSFAQDVTIDDGKVSEFRIRLGILVQVRQRVVDIRKGEAQRSGLLAIRAGRPCGDGPSTATPIRKGEPADLADDAAELLMQGTAV